MYKLLLVSLFNVFFVILNITCSIMKFILENIVGIATVVTPIVIAIVTHKHLKKQDEKILEDNKINRIANFHSTLFFDDAAEIIIDYNAQGKDNNNSNINVLAEGGCGKSTENTMLFELFIYFINGTSIHANKINIESITIAVNKIGCNILQFHNDNKNYKEIVIEGENSNSVKSIVSADCYINDLYKWNIENFQKDIKVNITMNFNIKNYFNISSKCIAKGEYIVNEIISDKTSKKTIKLKKEKGYIEIKNVSEEANNG